MPLNYAYGKIIVNFIQKKSYLGEVYCTQKSIYVFEEIYDDLLPY